MRLRLLRTFPECPNCDPTTAAAELRSTRRSSECSYVSRSGNPGHDSLLSALRHRCIDLRGPGKWESCRWKYIRSDGSLKEGKNLGHCLARHRHTADDPDPCCDRDPQPDPC